MSITITQHPKAAASVGFVWKTVLVQVVALGAAVILWPFHQAPLLAIATATVCALIAARFLLLPVAWRCINTVMPVALAINLSMSLPHWIFSVPLLLFVLTYAPALWTRVPYYPTPRAAYPLILAELPADRPFIFLDIGCGFADMLIFLAKHRPQGQFIGIEVGPLPWFIAKLKTIACGPRNVSVQFRDMWSFPLESADVVYTFLSPAAMARMWEKVSHEMRDGATFITNSFPVPAPCTETLQVRDERSSVLYIHRITKPNNG